MKAINISKKIIIFAIAIISFVLFGYYIYKSMGLKSKASGSGQIRISFSQSTPNPIPKDQPFTIGITLLANDNNKISAMDLTIDNQEDALDYIMPDATYPLENQATKAFDETVKLGADARPDGTKELKRLVMVAKRPLSELKSGTTLQLRFKARPSVAPNLGTTFVKINTTSSTIVGPNINNNLFTLSPANVTIALSFSTACGNTNCVVNQACYQNLCRTQCGSNYGCVGDYHCESGVCVPGLAPTGTGGNPSSPGAPTATPYPTAGPNAGDLIFKVKIPDLSSGVNVLPNVRLQLRDGGNPVEDKNILLQRVQGTDFFMTTTPTSFNVTGRKEYTLLVKQLKTVRRSFTVTLERGKTMDCTVDASCGSLGHSELAPLWAGDSDGFNDGSAGTTRSDSYNRIDAADLQKMVVGYKVTPMPAEPNADFNLDGKIDIFDLGILGKNFGKQGE